MDDLCGLNNVFCVVKPSDVCHYRLYYYYYYYYYVFILSAISPYTTGLKALFNQSHCTGTAPTHK